VVVMAVDDENIPNRQNDTEPQALHFTREEEKQGFAFLLG